MPYVNVTNDSDLLQIFRNASWFVVTETIIPIVSGAEYTRPWTKLLNAQNRDFAQIVTKITVTDDGRIRGMRKWFS